MTDKDKKGAGPAAQPLEAGAGGGALASGTDEGLQADVTTRLGASGFRPGLEGVVATRSSISHVDGERGVLEYRGIRIEELAEHSTFEETVFLLLYNHLPSQRELSRFQLLMAKQRHLPRSVLEAICAFPVGMHPIVALQAGTALLQGEDFYADEATSPLHNLKRCVSLVAKIPTVLAAFDRRRNGEEPLPSVSKYAHAANFLFMLTGEPPNPEAARVFDRFLILHAEHTMNASTFANRVIASTLGSVYSSISGAIGALSGPLHGGANERALRMLYSVGSPANVEVFVEEMVATGTRIMGVGHRVYRVKDPRASVLQRHLPQLLELQGGQELRDVYETALRLEEVVRARLGPRGIHANVDFYSGIGLEALGVPHDLFVAVFACARTVGWCTHWLEQVSTNRLFRPCQEYIGDHGRRYLPIEQR